MKKQILISSLSLAVIFALSACGSSEEPQRQRPPQNPRDARGPRGPRGPQGPQDIPDQGGPGPIDQPGLQGGPGPVAGPVGQPGGQPGPNVANGPQQGAPSAAGNKTPGPSRRKPSRQAPSAQIDQVPQGHAPVETSQSSTEDVTTTTYSRKSLNADIQNLQRTEQGLEAVGLRVVIVRNPDQSLKSVGFDSDLIDQYATKIHADASVLLKNYDRVGHEFLKKYNREFLVDGDSQESEKLSGEPMSLLTAKLALAERYLEAYALNLAQAKAKSKR